MTDSPPRNWHSEVQAGSHIHRKTFVHRDFQSYNSGSAYEVLTLAEIRPQVQASAVAVFDRANSLQEHRPLPDQLACAHATRHLAIRNVPPTYLGGDGIVALLHRSQDLPRQHSALYGCYVNNTQARGYGVHQSRDACEQ